MNKGFVYGMIAAGALTLSACASMRGEPPDRVSLKDGSTLYIDNVGGMTMTDKYGKPMSMMDGEPMEATDGTMLMMKNKVLYRSIMPKGGK
ncbi:CopK family periplasmic copper-binding protein [Crenobacter cavernae]|nr:CopK family periplasmic copper-binding protein [Crenobacter cavernae]